MAHPLTIHRPSSDAASIRHPSTAHPEILFATAAHPEPIGQRSAHPPLIHRLSIAHPAKHDHPPPIHRPSGGHPSPIHCPSTAHPKYSQRLVGSSKSFDQIRRGQARAVASFQTPREGAYADYCHGSMLQDLHRASLQQLDAIGEGGR